VSFASSSWINIVLEYDKSNEILRPRFSTSIFNSSIVIINISSNDNGAKTLNR